MRGLEVIVVILIIAVAIAYYNKYGSGDIVFFDNIAERVHDFIYDDEGEDEEVVE